jgi:Domain of unknown function (DUF4397)
MRHLKNNLKQLFWSLAGLFCLVIGGWRCVKAGSGTQTGSAYTYIGVINAASYGPPADMYMNGTIVTSSGGIPTGSFSKSYANFVPGLYDITFDKTGTDSVLYDLPSSSYDTATFYTLILYNGSPGGTGDIYAEKIADDFSTTSQSTANYRFFNLSPDVPGVDLYLNNTLVLSQQPTIANTAGLTLGQFQPLTPNSYNIVVKVAGGDSVLATASGVGMSEGNVYTVFLSGTNTAAGGDHLTINVMQAVL